MSLNIEHKAAVIIEEVKVVCCTFTDGIVVEVWFAFVARESVKRGSTFTLAGLLITGHAVGAMNIAVACYRDTQTHDTTEQCAFEESHIVGPAWTHTFNGSLSGITRVSQYQKGKTNLDFNGARDSEWQWHQLGHMQVCTLLQTDNHASTPPLSFLQAGCPSYHPTSSVKARKAPCMDTIEYNTISRKVLCGPS